MRRSGTPLRAAWLAVVAIIAALLAGCGAGAGSAQDTTASDGAGGGSNGGSSGGSTGGGSSGGSNGGSSGGTAGEICRIGILGYAGQWGQGNVFTDWLDTKSTQGTLALEGQELTPALLAPLQVVIVEDVRLGAAGQAGIGQGIGRAYSAAEVAALAQWVAAGGGLMTVTGFGDSSEIANVNRLLEPYGISYGSNAILFGGGGVTAPVTHWADHPLASGVTQVGADNGYPVLGGGTLVAWEPSPDQYPAGRAVESGKGHVFAWCDEWITYNSEWTGKPQYQVAQFWANTLTWLASTSGCKVPLPPGSEW